MSVLRVLACSILVAGASACATPPARIEVQLVTDYGPGTEFDGVEVTVADGPRSSSAADAARSYRRPVRVAVLDELAPARTRVTVTLRSRGTLVQAQPRVVDLRSGTTTIVTVSITRDCAGVVCPADTPSAIACLGGRCVEPTPDSDADGVLDTLDLCPGVADATQDDEDGDGLGDACDPCPPFVDGDPIADGDGDGVGDLCDPDPSGPGDRIVRFEGFEHYVPGSLALEGTWRFEGGQALVTSSVDALATATLPRPGTSIGTETVSTHVTIDAYYGDLTARAIGVVHERDPAADGGILCVFGDNPSNLEVFAIADHMTLSAFVLQPTSAPIGASATFASTRTNDDYRCVTPSLAAPMTATSTFRSATPTVGLYARSADARFDWLLVTTKTT